MSNFCWAPALCAVVGVGLASFVRAAEEPSQEVVAVEAREAGGDRGLGDPGRLDALRFEIPGGRATLRGEDARMQLVVSGMYDSGQLRDLTRQVTYSVEGSGDVDISPSGLVTPRANGPVEVRATLALAGGTAAVMTTELHVESIGRSIPVNFPNQVVPIFTKFGCNGGGCHGKSGGQNGFRLSLLGFYPEEDHEFLVKEGRGRRIFGASPDRSLLLQKAANLLPHGGGQRLAPDSLEYSLLRRWMAQGMPFGQATDPTVERIEVLPEGRVMAHGGEQQLRVLAYFSDGTVEDVTLTAQYESNVAEMAEVSEDGLVNTMDAAGDVAIMVRYQGHVDVFRATIPLGVEVTELPERKNLVDGFVFAKLKSLGVPPSQVTDDATFFRRVTIDIAGRIPTAGEVTAFLEATDPNKRERHIDELLTSSDYADYFANKWSAILRNKNQGGNNARGTYAFHRWIRDSLARNRPYDEFVRDIVAASGDMTQHPPVAWFRSVRTVEEQVEDSAQLFLGQRLQCARCHHHPFEKWSQRDYYSYSAFFSRVGRKTGKQGIAEEPRIFHQRGEATAVNPRSGEVVKPAGLGGETMEIPPARDPRLELAAWQSDPANPYFAKALVNRYWKHFFGRGLVEPEDDMRVTNPPTHPELLEALAEHFVESGYDLKGLVRLLCRSSTYQLSSIPNEYNQRDTQSFSRYYPKRLTAEVLYDAVNQVSGSPPAFDGMPKNLRAVSLPDPGVKSYFLTVFGRPQGDSSCECERTQEANLAQSLHLMNSKQIQERIGADTSRAALLAKDTERSDEDKIRELTRWAFAREALPLELEVSGKHLASKKEKREAFEDIVWALINTKEFLFNH